MAISRKKKYVIAGAVSGLILALPFLIGGACKLWDHVFPTHPRLARIKHADPMVALKAELAKGNTFFVASVDNVVPGLMSGEHQELVSSYGYRPIEGASDAGNAAHFRLMTIACEYARTYNEALLKEILEKKLPPGDWADRGWYHPLHLEGE